MYNYAITINHVQDPVFISDYYDFIADVKKRYPTSNMEYHFESKRSGVSDRLHMHATLTNHKKIKMTTLFKPYKKGWSVLWKEDPDIGWDRYISKYQEDETDLINEEHEKEKAFLDFQKTEGEASSSEELIDYDKDESLCDMILSQYEYPRLDIRKL